MTAQRTVVSSVDVANEPDVMVAVNVTNQTLDTDYTIESLSAASVYLIVVKAMNELPQTGPGSQAVMATTTEAGKTADAIHYACYWLGSIFHCRIFAVSYGIALGKSYYTTSCIILVTKLFIVCLAE